MPNGVKIAIVGVSAIFPGGRNAKEFWNRIVDGADLISTVPASRWNVDDYYNKDPKAKDKIYCRRGGFIPDIEFDPLEWGIPPQNLQATDTAQLLALITAKELLNDVYQGKFLGTDFSRTSVFLGMTCSLSLLTQMSGRICRPIWEKSMREYGIDEESVKEICDRICQYFPEWQENTFPGLLQNVVAGRIANRLNLGGTNCTIDAACASSFAAIHQGINELRLHQSDMVIVGGVDLANDPMGFYLFSKTPALSPTEDCCPFSDKSNGTLLSEGLGLFALKRLEDAEKDGNQIYAVIRGIGTSSDGRSKSIYAPVAQGQAFAFQRAYEMAGYGPRSVELLEAHGTGTKAGDKEEFQSSQTIFNSDDHLYKQWCALGSIKSQIGHAKGAAGAAGLFKIVMALHHKILPPTIKIEQPNPELNIKNSPFYLNTKARPWIKNPGELRRASTSSFGFGGTNFHITVEEYKGIGNKPGRINTSAKQLVLLSASSKDKLIQQCKAAVTEFAKYGYDYFPYFTHTSYLAFKQQDTFRLGMLVADGKDTCDKMSSIISNLTSFDNSDINNQKDIYYSDEISSGKLAIIFSGQGSQYLNMGLDVAMMFNSAREIWDKTTEIHFDEHQSLHEVVFPRPAFSDDEKRKQKELINDTIWTQPALAAMAYSQLALLNDLGIKADCVAGHSFGELVALGYAGAFDIPTLIKLARKRGELMAESSGDKRGGMLVVIHPIEEALRILSEEKLSLFPANYNSPTEIVLSGPIDEIEKAKQLFGKRKIKSVQLNVSNAFHSPDMKNAALNFSEELNNISIGKLSIPVFSNVTTKKYTNKNVKKTLSEALSNPVRFSEMIESMYEDGVRTFIEVGPNSILTNLVKTILQDKKITAIALDQKNSDGVVSFLKAVGQLAVNGVPLNLNRLLGDVELSGLPEDKEQKKHKLFINGTNIKPQIPPLNKSAATKLKEVKIDSGQKLAPSQPLSSQPHEMAELYIQLQKSITSAHEVYQKSTSESHQAFLNMVENTFHSLNGLKSTDSFNVNSPVIKTNHGLFSEEKTKINEQLFKQDASSIPINNIPEINLPTDTIKIETKTLQQLNKSITLGMQSTINSNEPKISQAEISSEMTSQTTHNNPLAEKQDLVSHVLSIVAQETGYPVDMLSLTMEMEADLGIDSIKRVEILSAIKSAMPNLPELDPMQLTEIKTLQQLNEFITSGMLSTINSDESKISQAEISSEMTSQTTHNNPPAEKQDLVSHVLFIVAQETGYPVDMLSLTMEMEADLGIDSIKRVEILSAIKSALPNLPELDPMQLIEIKTLQQLSDFVNNERQFDLKKKSNNTQINTQINTRKKANCIRKHHQMIDKPFSQQRIQGLLAGNTIIIEDKMNISAHLASILNKNGIQAKVIHSITDLPDEYHCVIYLDGLQTFNSIDDAIKLNYDAFKIVKATAKTISGNSGSLILVQHTSGDFGLSGKSDIQAWSAGLVSLARTLSLEWPHSFIKTYDIEDIQLPPQTIAQRLADELLYGGDDKEVGLLKGERRAVLEEIDLPYGSEESFPLSDNSVVLVTGGARGVTAWCVEAIAAHRPMQFILLGRTQLVDIPEYCYGANTESELKQAIYNHAKTQRLDVSSKKLSDQANLILANREILQTLENINKTGSKAIYYSVDAKDAEQLSHVVSEVVSKYGHINGLIHGAGVIHDHLITQKSDVEFDSVFSTKVHGLLTLLQVLKDQPLQLICAFSSLVARYGNQGQADYAMANQVMNTVLLTEQFKRGMDCRVKSIEWGAWKGGMVTSSLQNKFQSIGVKLIDKDLGTELFIKELSQPNSTLVHLRCTDENVVTAADSSKINEMNVEYKIAPDTHSFLLSHCIKGKPVIPVCLVLDWFMRSIRRKYPDMKILNAHNLQVLHGVRLDTLDNSKFTVELQPLEQKQQNDILIQLKSDKRISCYQAVTRINSIASDVKLNSPIQLDDEMHEWPWHIDECYGDLSKLFHGPDFQAIQSLDEYGDRTATATLIGSKLLNWKSDAWVTDPCIVDGAFQVASLFGQRFFKRITIPMKINEISIHEEGLCDSQTRCIVQLISHNEYQANYNIVILNNDKNIMELKGLEMIVMP